MRVEGDQRPLLVFCASEREAFDAAHRSQLAMRVFMAGKLREIARHIGGRHRERVGSSPYSDWYSDGAGGKLIVEWHSLVQAQQAWQGQLAKR